MSLRLIRFAVIMLAALSLGVGIGHLMELPARMAWDQDLWVGATAQGGFYALSGPLGVLLQVFTIIALIVLAILLRRHSVGVGLPSPTVCGYRRCGRKIRWNRHVRLGQRRA